MFPERPSPGPGPDALAPDRIGQETFGGGPQFPRIAKGDHLATGLEVPGQIALGVAELHRADSRQFEDPPVGAGSVAAPLGGSPKNWWTFRATSAFEKARMKSLPYSGPLGQPGPQVIKPRSRKFSMALARSGSWVPTKAIGDRGQPASGNGQ